MNKGKYTMFILSGLLAMACNKELVPEQGNDNNSSMVPMEIVAEISDLETKTSVDLNTGIVTWQNGDNLVVFDAPIDNKNNAGFEFKTADNGATATFTGTFPQVNSGNMCAVYPYDRDATVYNGKITTDLSPVQNAVPDGIDRRSVIMGTAATVEEMNANKLSFKNLCGIVSFTLSANSADVKSIALKGNNGEILSGTPQFDLKNSKTLYQVTQNVHSNSYVILRNSDETPLVPGKKYSFSILPGEFTKGFSFIVTFMNGSQKILKAGLQEGITYSVARNQISYIGEIDVTRLTKVCHNEYVLWESGCNLKVGNKTYNNLTGDFAGKSGKLITKANQTEVDKIKDGRVYFIEPDATAELGGNRLTNLLVVGTDPDVKSGLIKSGQIVLEDGAKVAFKNVNYSPASSATGYNLFSAGGAGQSPVQYMVFDNCTFDVFANNSLVYASATHSVADFVMMNSDCRLNVPTVEGKSSYIYTSPTAATSSFVFENNLFYSEHDLVDFKLFNDNASTLSNVVLKNNSFINTYFEREGYVNAYRITQFSLVGNLLYVPKYGTYAVNKKGAQQYWGILFAYGEPNDAGKHGSTLTDYPKEGMAEAVSNFHYREAVQDMKTLKATFADLKNGSTYYQGVVNPKAFEANPFTSLDYANGVFVRTEEQPKVGAQR